jgi:hypothetical protein
MIFLTKKGDRLIYQNNKDLINLFLKYYSPYKQNISELFECEAKQLFDSQKYIK